jgi:hypothetical protein
MKILEDSVDMNTSDTLSTLTTVFDIFHSDNSDNDNDIDDDHGNRDTNQNYFKSGCDVYLFKKDQTGKTIMKKTTNITSIESIKLFF